MRNILGVCVTFLMVGVISLVPNEASAHSSCSSGSEYSGWIVNCDHHLGKTYTSYSFEYGLDYSYKSNTYTGVANWNNTGIVDISYSSGSDNVVGSYGGPDGSTVAYASTWANSSGHTTRWEINYNRYHMDGRSASANSASATQEFGHAVGIADLYNSINSNKLMYGYESRSVGYPTSSDREGAREAVSVY